MHDFREKKKGDEKRKMIHTLARVLLDLLKYISGMVLKASLRRRLGDA
jgi:hypothetical protein